MKIYIWKRLNNVSSNFHSDGGLVIIAESLEKAKELVSQDKYIVINEEPDIVLEIEDSAVPEYIVFPDAGCC